MAAAACDGFDWSECRPCSSSAPGALLGRAVGRSHANAMHDAGEHRPNVVGDLRERRRAATSTRSRSAGADRSQTADVHRMVMPPTAEPRLVTKKLGTLGDLHGAAREPQGQARNRSGQRRLLLRLLDRRASGSTFRATPRSPRASRCALDPNARVSWASTRTATRTTARSASMARWHTATQVFAIDSLNWHSISDAGVAIYTPAWADVQDAKRPAGVVEWVVKKNKIIDVRTGTPDRQDRQGPHQGGGLRKEPRRRWPSVPRCAAPLWWRSSRAQQAACSLREAIGRGVSLVDAGEVALPCEGKWYQQRPRTTVGWDARRQLDDALRCRAAGTTAAATASAVSAWRRRPTSPRHWVSSRRPSSMAAGRPRAMVRRSDGAWDRVDDQGLDLAAARPERADLGQAHEVGTVPGSTIHA